MTSLHQTLPFVHSDWRSIAIVGLPERGPSVEPEPFHPSAKDEAYDLGYRLARDGERPWPTDDSLIDRDVLQSFANGARAGQNARGVAEARELGRALGASGSGISEPAAGYSAAEAEAYRAGYQAGQDDLIEALQDEWMIEDYILEHEAEHEAEVHHAELVEGAGVFAARGA